MKRTFIFSACTLIAMLSLAVLLTSCKEDESIIEEPVIPNVTVALNTTSFLPGDVLTVTLIEDSGAAERDDIPLTFSVTNSETGLSAADLFTDFTSSAVLSATASLLSVDYTVIDNVEDNYTLDFTVSAEGCTVANGQTTIYVGTAYAVTLSITDNEDGSVTEGSTFTLTASTPVAPDADLTIDLSYSDGADSYFTDLPETVTIPSGQTSGQTAEITVTTDDGDYQSDCTFTVSGVSQSAHYTVVNEVEITRKDRDDYLYNETWVYSDPAQTFVSNTLLESYNSYGNNSNYVVMTKATDGTGSQHPNSELAAEGWTLLNTCEFPYIPKGMYYPCFSAEGEDNLYGNNYISSQTGWAEESTVSMQENCYVSYEKFTNVTEDGYVRIWSAYDEGEVTVGGASQHYTLPVGTEIAKANNNGNYPNYWAQITEGTRVEVRARIRGKRQGYNTFMRLLGSRSGNWPQPGQISILENPVYLTDSDPNLVQQNCYYGKAGEHLALPSDFYDINTSEWNIYWVEIVDSEHIKVGINGLTTLEIGKSDHSDYSNFWPFNKSLNPNGFYLLLGPKPADAVVDEDGFSDEGLQDADWADPGFKNISYEESKTSDDSPHMDIDWVRVWRNENYGGSKTYYYDDCWFF